MNQDFRPISAQDELLAEVLGMPMDGDATVLYARLARLTDIATIMFQDPSFVLEKGMSSEPILRRLESRKPVLGILTERQTMWRETHPAANSPHSLESGIYSIYGIEVRGAIIGEEVTQEFADLMQASLQRMAPEYGIENLDYNFNIGNTPMAVIVAGMSRD